MSGELQHEQEGENAGTGTTAAAPAPLQPQHHRKHTLLHSAGKLHTQTSLQPHTNTHTYMALTGIRVRRGFGFKGLLGMHGVAKYGLGSLLSAPSEGEVGRITEEDNIRRAG